MTRRTALVTGAGGFIGHHLVKYLQGLGYEVRGADIKAPEYEETTAEEFELVDLRHWEDCLKVTRDVDEVYQLAADMGGIGYITAFHADIARNNVLINAHMLQAAAENQVSRYFYASSACIYPMYRQESPEVTPLKEEDAYPADPEEGYGWEKLYAEKLCQYYTEEGKLDTRVARFHNIYGPVGTYDGGREKAPAAICRKVALAADGDEIEVWGDGQQTRSYCYVSDCVEGLYRLMQSDHHEPINLGQDRMVTVDELVDMVAAVAGKTIKKRHDLTKPQGVRGRNADLTLMRSVLGWEPEVSLEDGLASTYAWITEQAARRAQQPVTGGR
ncbi:MAG TPA: NAD-dependent epimerase/dehydratase family protein [Actinomycetota bacterium]|nr:NAD-dependent epimerase/dehydratase family protein [Actinomycetota bacterium]